LPAFQQIYTSLSQIRSNLAAFDSLHDDFIASREPPCDVSTSESERKSQRLVPSCAIQLDQVVFAYPGKQTPALRGLSLDIPVNQVIGLVGASGSGKSTAIDLLLGLIAPQAGRLLIDGQPLSDSNRRNWQNSLGFVP